MIPISWPVSILALGPDVYKRQVSYLMYNIMNIFPDKEDEFYPNGCSLIFRKSEIGEPFDPDYFYYGEDTYLGLKARFMGMRIKFAKDSIAVSYTHLDVYKRQG